MVFELHMMKEKEEEERRIAKFSRLLFSASELGSKTLGALLTIVMQRLLVCVLAHFAVVITELLPYLKGECDTFWKKINFRFFIFNI